MVKILLLPTWYNLADEAVSHAVARDLVFMKFCNFTLAGCLCSNVCRFQKKVVVHNLFKALLDSSNASIERQGLKLSNGKYVSADATLIESARRPRQKLSSTKLANGTYATGEVAYANASVLLGKL